MRRSMKLDNDIVKTKLRDLIMELFYEDYGVTTIDRENYMFKEKVSEGAVKIHNHNWMDICLCIIPEVIGMDYLIIPVNDPEFNLAEYIVNYYEAKFNSDVINEVSEPEEGLAVIRNLRDIPQYLANKKRMKEANMNEKIGNIISTHV